MKESARSDFGPSGLLHQLDNLELEIGSSHSNVDLACFSHIADITSKDMFCDVGALLGPANDVFSKIDVPLHLNLDLRLD